MQLKKPNTIEECLYFTNRAIRNGFATAWVYRKQCPSCKKPSMGKPLKKGKVDKKADYYECSLCKYRESSQDAKKSLKLEVKYKCHYCGNEGETTTEYRRIMFSGIPSYVFECQKCNKKIMLTKKLKEAKQ